jgi:TusA-related sulfurtransferase
MVKETLDTTDVEWSQVIFRIAAKVVVMRQGDVLEIIGNHPSFEAVIRTWCERLKKNIISVTTTEKGGMRCQIQF